MNDNPSRQATARELIAKEAIVLGIVVPVEWDAERIAEAISDVRPPTVTIRGDRISYRHRVMIDGERPDV